MLLFVGMIHSLIFKTGNHDHTEIRDIWCPGVGLAGTWDIMAQIWDIPDNPVWMETLGLGDGSSPAGSRGRAPIEGLGDQKLMEYSSQNP